MRRLEIGHVHQDLESVAIVLDVRHTAAAADRPAQNSQRGRVGQEAAAIGRVEEGRVLRLQGGGVQ